MNKYQAKVFNPRHHSRRQPDAQTRAMYVLSALMLLTLVVFGLMGWLDTGAHNTPLDFSQAAISGGITLSH